MVDAIVGACGHLDKRVLAGLLRLIWQSLPASHTWLGAAIVVASGLYLVRREKRITEVHATAERP